MIGYEDNVNYREDCQIVVDLLIVQIVILSLVRGW